MKHRTALFISMYFALGTLSAQNPVIQWQNTLGGSSTEVMYDGQQTADGGYIVAGNTNSSDGDVAGNHGGVDGWIVKLDASGAINWQRAVGGTSTDVFYAVQQIPDGGYIAAGYTGSSNGDVAINYGEVDAWVVRFNDVGGIVWEKTYGWVSTDVANAITATADGGFVFAGITWGLGTSGDHGLADYWVVKLDAGGNELWQIELGGSNHDNATSVVQLTDGGYLISGSTASSDGDVTGNHGQQDVWMVKLSEAGVLLWQKCLGGSNLDNSFVSRQTTDGGYIVAAGSLSNDGDVSGGHGYNDAWIVKLNETGGIEWQKMLGGSQPDRAKDIQQTADGGYIFIGDADSQDGDLSGSTAISDIWLVKLNPLGAIQWQRTLGGSSIETGYAMDQTDDGGYLIVGEASSNDGDVSGVVGDDDAWVVKLSGGEVGIDELDGLDISMGPNPCKGLLYITAAQQHGELNISLIDALGRNMLQKTMVGSTLTLDLSDMACGLYMLNVKSAEGVRSERIVLE